VIFKLRNQKTKQATPVPPGEHSVGREDFNYIHINEPSVSRRHARLINSNEGIFVEDLGSANGTAVRGSFITGMTQVSFGDMIYFGQEAFGIEPEVPGEKHNLPTPGLKNPNPNRSRFRHDTEKLPVGHIQFEDSAPTPPEAGIDDDKLDVEVHEPAPAASVAQPPAPAPAAPAPSPVPDRAPAPAASPAPAPAPSPAPAAASPIAVPEVTRRSAEEAPRPSAASQPNITVVSLNTAIVLAFLAGLGIGALLGIIIGMGG